MIRLLTASLIWSLSFGFIGNLLAGLPPATVALTRLAIASLVFLPAVRRAPPRTLLTLTAIGALQLGLMSLAYMHSFRYLRSHEVVLFTVTTPLYVTLLADLWQRRFRALNLTCAFLAVAGAAVVLSRAFTWRASLVGFTLVQASNLCFALGQLAYRNRMRGAHAPADPGALFWTCLGGAALLLPFAARECADGLPRPSPVQLATLLYLGVIASGLAIYLWNSGTRRVQPGVLAVMNNLKIPLGVAASLLLFGEHAHPAALLAGSLLLAAALVPVLLRRC